MGAFASTDFSIPLNITKNQKNSLIVAKDITELMGNTLMVRINKPTNQRCQHVCKTIGGENI